MQFTALTTILTYIRFRTSIHISTHHRHSPGFRRAPLQRAFLVVVIVDSGFQEFGNSVTGLTHYKNTPAVSIFHVTFLKIPNKNVSVHQLK